MIGASLHHISLLRRFNATLYHSPVSEEFAWIIVGDYSCHRWTEDMLDTLQVDHRGGYNIRDTPRRVADTLLNETIDGSFAAPVAVHHQKCQQPQAYDCHEADCDAFDRHYPSNADLWPCVYRSCICEGRPAGRISKYHCIISSYAIRSEIWEALMQQVGRYIIDTTVLCISAKSMCRIHCVMLSFYRRCMASNVYLGMLATERGLRDEFLRECPDIGCAL